MANPAEIFQKADAAGREAVEKLNVVPMVVEDADPISGKAISGGARFFVADGVCGFAWVKIRPARGEFVKFLKDRKLGRKDEYEGGFRMPIMAYNQSLQKKEAYAEAFAKVLNENGINAYAGSRMD